MPKATWGNIEGNPFEDDLEDYDVYDGEMPPKGVYRCTLKFLRLKENSNGDPMLNGLLVINEPKGSKKSQYNGYDFWFNQNVTKQGAPYLNNFLSALVSEDKVPALRKAFWGQKVMLDKNEPPNVVSIGTLKLLDKTPLVAVNTKLKTYNGDVSLDVSKFMRPKDEDLGTDAPVEDEEEWVEEPDADADAPESEGEGDEELAEREEELSEMTLAELKKIARGELGMKLAEVKGLDEEGLIDAILEREFPEGDDEPDEPEEDEEDEEEPPKRTRRSAVPAPAARQGRSATPAAEEAPARARTGTRRRKAAA